MTLDQRIVQQLGQKDGMSDRELTNALIGQGMPQQPINGACRRLQMKGILSRTVRPDGVISNNLLTVATPVVLAPVRCQTSPPTGLSEDEVKSHLKRWLEQEGWTVNVAWGHSPGVDICASRNEESWLIEVTGPGSLSAMRVNYFLAILGETLQRMQSPKGRYSIALPDMQQYRGLWERLPELAKQRTQITALFVSSDGKISECR